MNYRIVMAVYCTAFAVYSWDVYTAGTDAPHVMPMTEQARLGQDLFQQNNCIACHQFYGLGGYMGPDLTNFVSNRGPAATAIGRAFIVNGTATMPNLGLDESQADAILEYLAFVDQTGTYPAEDYDILWWGAVTQVDDPT